MADIPVYESTAETVVVVTANGQTTFAFDFLVLFPEQMTVLHGRGDVETVLTYPVDFSVSGLDQPNGGTVALNVATLANDVITMRRVTPIERLNDWQAEGDYKAALVNREQDTMFMIMQELSRDTGKTAADVSVMDGRITLEQQLRIAADAALGGRIDNEAYLREAGDRAVASLIGQAGPIETQVFDSQLAAGMANIKPTTGALWTGGRNVPGDWGGARHRRVFAEPAHPGKFILADGSWAELAEFTPNVVQLGADPGAENNYQAFTDAIEYMSANGGGTIVVPPATFNTKQTIQGKDNVHIVGCGDRSQIRGDDVSGAVVAIGQAGSVGGPGSAVNAGISQISIGGVADLALSMVRAQRCFVENISLAPGTFTDGIHMSTFWGSRISKIHTYMATISRYCIDIGAEYNGNSFDTLYTGNTCEANVHINSSQGHGNNFTDIILQGGRYGLDIGSTGYGAWEFNTIYTEGVVHPIKLGDREGNGIARNVILNNLSLSGSNNESHPYYGERFTHILLDYAAACSINTVSFDGNGSTGGTSAAVTGDGSGAQAIVVTGADGVIKGISPRLRGSGYTEATVTINGSGTGATAEAVIEGGRVVRYVVTNGGSGYGSARLPFNIVYNAAHSCTIRNPFQIHTSLGLPCYPFVGRTSDADANSAIEIEGDVFSPVPGRAIARFIKAPGSGASGHNWFVEWMNGSGTRDVFMLQPPIV